jgi:hypothetical protein
MGLGTGSNRRINPHGWIRRVPTRPTQHRKQTVKPKSPMG